MLAVTQTYENVRQVARGLSELNDNIRRYVERGDKTDLRGRIVGVCNSTIIRTRWDLPITR